MLLLWLCSPLLPIRAKPETQLFEQVWQTVNDNYQRLEGKGVIPDINIPFPLEYAQGVDPQKQKAIETVLQAQFSAIDK